MSSNKTDINSARAARVLKFGKSAQRGERQREREVARFVDNSSDVNKFVRGRRRRFLGQEKEYTASSPRTSVGTSTPAAGFISARREGNLLKKLT